jgi:hypothetical protein
MNDEPERGDGAINGTDEPCEIAEVEHSAVSTQYKENSHVNSLCERDVGYESTSLTASDDDFGGAHVFEAVIDSNDYDVLFGTKFY